MTWTVADAVDYKGFPADKSKTGGWVPASLILGLFSRFPLASVFTLIHCFLPTSFLEPINLLFLDVKKPMDANNSLGWFTGEAVWRPGRFA
jgi:hypothetical protein